MEPGGFVDLRLNRGDREGNESFWPSFTDIMTVVVLIFLIAMVVVLLRNMELVRELRATLEAERQAMELARAAGQEKETLGARLEEAREQLAAADRHIAELEERLARLEEQNQVRARALADRERELERLQAEREALEEQSARLEREREEARGEARTAREARQTLAAELAAEREARRRAEEALARKELQVAALQARLRSRETELARTREERQDVEEKYLALADRYDELKVRYDRLVRPARSPEGRHLVEVRYFKRDGTPHIEWRTGGEGPFRAVTLRELEARLERLKADHPEGLYVKVILPEGSGLSFSEAWRFTNRLHRAYDYYYQEPAAASGPAGGEASAP